MDWEGRDYDHDYVRNLVPDLYYAVPSLSVDASLYNLPGSNLGISHSHSHSHPPVPTTESWMREEDSDRAEDQEGVSRLFVNSPLVLHLTK